MNRSNIVKKMLSVRKKYDYKTLKPSNLEQRKKVRELLSYKGLYLMRYDVSRLGILKNKYGQPTKYLKVGMVSRKEGIWYRIVKNHFGSSGVLHRKLSSSGILHPKENWLERDEILVDLLNKIEGYQYDFGNNLKDRQKFLRTYCYFNIILFPNSSEKLIREKEKKLEEELWDDVRYIRKIAGKRLKKNDYRME